MAVTLGGLVTTYNSASDNNYDTPTNPLLSFSPAIANSNRIFSIIYEHNNQIGSTPYTVNEAVGGIGLLKEYSNLQATNGFTIRCYDAKSDTGLDLGNINETADDYFVLIHSDNKDMHHLAKITKVVSADEDGDMFEFSPRLGSEIKKGVKFIVFKGPDIASSDGIVAISLGIKSEVDKLVCARPLFYFYDSALNGELEHNKKYFLRTNTISNTSTAASLQVTGDNTTFVTVSDFRNKIIDYSKFTYKITMVDKLKELDDPDTATANESTLLSGTYTDLTDYDDCFINARRDISDDASILTMRGKERYVHYHTSPENNNFMPTVYEAVIEDTFDAKSGYAEIKISDTTKNLSNKVFNNDRLVVRQKIKEDDFNDWVEVGEIDAIYDATLRIYDIKTVKPKPLVYFTDDMEIKIGSRICIVDYTSGTTRLALKTRNRLETESAFTTTSSVTGFTNGTKIYRRRLNPADSTYVTNANYDGDKLAKLSLIISSSEYTNHFASILDFITNVDEEYGLLTIDFGNNLLDSSSALERVVGNAILYYEAFFGKVEQIDRKLTSNQTIFEVRGRNTISKLVDIIINKDALFSSDIIYSSESPYNDLTDTGETATWSFTSKVVTFSNAVTLADGDHLWCDYGYIGQVDGTGGTFSTWSLHEYPYTATDSASTVYKENSKMYIYNKALAANNKVTTATSMTGASDKGFFFRDGAKLTGDFDALTEGASLVGTGQDTNALAVGYDINNVKNVDGELDFQSEVNGFTDNVVNTLLDFTVLNVKENNNIKTVKLAPYMPLTLGREELNESSAESTYSNLATVSTAQATAREFANCNPATFSDYDLPIGTPLFIDEVYIGNFMSYHILANASPVNTVRIYFDRKVVTAVGDIIQTGDGKKVRSLHLINGSHLHGSKIVNMLGPNNKPIDYELTYDNSQTISKYKRKFGADIFRVFNLEKGTIGKRKKYLVIGDTSSGAIQPYYGDTTLFRYFAEAYKGHPDTSGGLSLTSKTGGSTNKHRPIERRGFEPITTSNYVDREFVSAADEHNVLIPTNPNVRETLNIVNPFDTRDKFLQLDPKAARLFLFCNSDRLLYSSERRDSLLNANNSINISNYGLMSIDEPVVTTSSTSKTNMLGETKTLTNLDEDYKYSTIVSSNKTVSSLKRIGLMRLTDVVYDWAFNQFNPEFDVPNDRVVEASDISFFKLYNVQDSSSNDLTVSSTGINTITMSANVDNVVANDFIIDDTTKRLVGRVTQVANAVISLDNSANTKSDGGFAYASGDNVKFAKASEFNDSRSTVIGRGAEETVLFEVGASVLSSVGNDIHMLKGLITNEDRPSIWEDYYIDATPSSYVSASGHMKDLRTGTAYDKNTVFLPVAFVSTIKTFSADSHTFTDGFLEITATVSVTGSQDYTDWSVSESTMNEYYPSSIFKMYADLGFSNDSSPSSSVDTKIGFLKTVALKKYKLQTKEEVDVGVTSPFHSEASLNANFRTSNPTYAYTSKGRFVTTTSFNTADEFADESTGHTTGAYLGFKPHLIVASVTNSNVNSIENTSLKRNVFNLNYDNYKFLQYVDLTGCYLVPAEDGEYYEGNDTVDDSSLDSNHNVTIADNKIIYVVSHEYDISVSSGGVPKCILITDQSLEAIKYKIMQPNPVCFWPKSPQKIRLNTLSSGYTKRMDSDEMYDTFSSFGKGDTGAGTRDDDSNLEGVQSMYVMVDIDNLSAEGNTIVKTATGRETILADFTNEYCISDGETTYETSIAGIDNGDDIGHYLEFGEVKRLDGVVSISETFELTVNGNITRDAKRALIGTNVSIAKEVEDVVEELLIQNDIDYELTKEDYAIFASPDFQGINLFNVLNYILRLKNKKLVDFSGKIKIKNYDSSEFISKYTFTDDDIFQISTVKSQFDYFNHVTVYGQTHKATRKDFRGIKKRGKKTLEVFENKFVTQDDCDKEASRLLKLHTTANEVIQVSLVNSEVKTLSVGDVVQLESQASGIELKEYLILEMHHSYNGIIDLKLGQYTKGLEDALAEMLIENSKTNSYLRKKEFNENENQFDFFDQIKVKEMHLLIRKRSASGATLGFSTTLNTATNTLGFGGGVTFTRLLEEDL